uniref:Uncharacterized protein n=1 Tax=Paramormyrops kingsleyae TaxID=1676925 RepID=A0A3B3RDH8_9TELE
NVTMLNRLKQLGYGYKVEPARRAAQVIHKKLVACLQSQQGLESDRRMKKLPLMMLSVSMADSFKDFDVLEMCCFMQSFLAKTLADFEVQLEKDVLEPLNNKHFCICIILLRKKMTTPTTSFV